MVSVVKVSMITALAVTGATADFPEAEITNGVVTAKFHMPDAERGYYRGTRFDWSGQISSLRTLGHEYFGQWFERYDPKLHDAIMGPVEEFMPGNGGLGYADAAPDGTFIRIGVGVVRKPQEKQYQRFKTYEIVDPGKWQVHTGKDRIEFVHELDGKDGYAYRYTKTVRLVKGRPEMVIEHVLKNTGKKRIETSQYNHNFFVIDGQPTGPESRVQVPFELRATKAFTNKFAEARGKEIIYTEELPKGQNTYAEFDGFGKSSSDYDIRLENRAAGAGVRITGDQPLAKLVYWSIRTTFCPEPYIDIAVDPGKTSKWNYKYEFYQLQKH